MKSTLKMSVLLVALLLTLSLLFTGCSDELEAKVDENATKAQTAVDDAAKKAQENLDKAVTELKALIAENASAADLTKALEELNAAIDAAEKAAADADTALEAKLQAAITEAATAANTAVATAKTELTTLINAKADTTALTTATQTLNAAIDAAETAATKADTELRNELTAAIETAKNGAIDAAKAELDAAVANLATSENLEAAKKELADSIENVKKVVDTLQGVDAATQADVDAKIKAAIDTWNTTTDTVVADLDALDAAYNALNPELYTEVEFAEITSAYNTAWIKIVRSVDGTASNAALKEFTDVVAATPSIADVIYNYLQAAKAELDKIDPDNVAEADAIDAYFEAAKTNLNDAWAELDAAATANVTAVIEQIGAYMPAGATDTVNLYDLYKEYQAEYNSLFAEFGGWIIKADMEAIVKELITPTDAEQVEALKDIRDNFDVWVDANDIATIDGLADALVAFEAAEARMAELQIAKAEADAINVRIEALLKAITIKGGHQDNYIELTDLQALVPEWVDTYGLDTDAEMAEPAPNYNMVKHANLEEAAANFNEAIAEYAKAAEEFMAAVKAIGTVDLMSWDELAAAQAEYKEWVIESKVEDFSYLFDGKLGPDDYFKTMNAAQVEYDKLQAAALDAYNNLKGAVTVTVKTIDLYDTTVDELLDKWYAKYCLTDEEGNIIFTNEGTDVTGYVLSDELTVDQADYDAIVELKTALETLKDAKTAQTNKVKEMFAEIELPITTHDEKALINWFKVYSSWHTGWAMAASEELPNFLPEGFLPSQFEIDPDIFVEEWDLSAEKAKYDEYKATLDALLAEVDAINALIDALDDKAEFADFADAADYAAYVEALKAINDAIDAFVEKNGDLDNRISQANLDKVATGELAVVKYDAIVALIAACDEAKAGAANLATVNPEAYVATLDAILAAAMADIDVVTIATENAETVIADAAAFATVKFEAIVKVATADAAARAQTTEEDKIKGLNLVTVDVLADLADSEVTPNEAAVDSRVALAGEEFNAVLNGEIV